MQEFKIQLAKLVVMNILTHLDSTGIILILIDKKFPS